MKYGSIPIIVLLLLLIPAPVLAGPMALLKEARVVITYPVKGGDKIRGFFFMGNPGDSPLTIMDIATDCACSKASFDRTIQPGAWGRIILQVDTRGESGKNAKNATVYTSDPNNYEMTISLVYNIPER